MSFSSFEERPNTASNLWRQPSMRSATSSIITSSSGGEDSFQSLETLSTDLTLPYNQSIDQLSILQDGSAHYYQLIDDLAIIDDLYQSFQPDEIEEDIYERQVADVARNVAQKKHDVDQIYQLESQFVQDLTAFHQVYLVHLQRWIHEPSNTDLFNKNTCHREVLTNLFDHVLKLLSVHQHFLNNCKERLDMWGPTQFISDIFSSLYEKISVYEPYLELIPNVVVSLDTLYSKSSSFLKFLESCAAKTDNQVKDIIYYIKRPIQRFSMYVSTLSHIISVTEPSHPDYKALIRIRDKFNAQDKQWRTLIKDRLAHIRALEAARSMIGSPVSVSVTRRLYITGLLTKVDLSDAQSMSDTRTYLLYSDYFIYGQKIKPNIGKKPQPQKLQYKGVINLRNAELKPLSEQIVAKISESKKTSVLTAAFKRNKQTEPQPMVYVYGFQLKIDQALSDNAAGTILPGTVVSNGVVTPHISTSKQQFIFRTSTEAEQNAWMSMLKKAVSNVSVK
ncbi:hypothetical protein RMATCC62417_13961 [Rhizopus microsporus]|nr:hypothetical protein RMATCC62417_13961 [Rhizopus microsporus]